MYVPAKPYEPPRVDYREPVQVSEPYQIRFKRLEYLVAALKKGFEFADQSLQHIQETKDPQMLEVANANYRKQMDELDKLWKVIHAEVEALKNGEFSPAPAFRGDLSEEDKKTIGKATVTVLIFNAPRLQTPLLNGQYQLWEAQLRM